MNIYLDNAATTPLDQKVKESIIQVMESTFGNPSSIHAYGRKAKVVIEQSRKTIAHLLYVAPSEIFFTSGGTEANNTAINGAVYDLQLSHVITSIIEHPSVLNPLQQLERKGKIQLNYVHLLPDGHIDLTHLEKLLTNNPRSFVSLMHANNEIGNLLPLQQVSHLCQQHNAVFHSDTVQTVGHYPFHLDLLHIDFISCGAHKFHGPKGIGFLYVNDRNKINPIIFGGSQERNLRAGTENIYGIVGLEKAMEIAYQEIEKEQEYIEGLKKYMIQQLEEQIQNVDFNGDAKGESLYTILNVLFPPTDKAEMLLYNLDIAGIAVSGGSACSSGSNQVSPVLEGIKADTTRPSLRFSFSKYNTKEELDYCVSKLKEIFETP